GYDAKVKTDKHEKQSRKEKQIERMKWKLVISAVLSVPLLLTMLDHLFGVQMPAIFMNPWFQFALATPVQFIIGWQFYDGAYKILRSGGATMDVLLALGRSAAYFYRILVVIKTTGTQGSDPHLYVEAS